NNGKTLVGESTPPKEGPTTALVYDGNRWTIKVGDKTVAGGVFKIDATKSPKEIDIMDETGAKNEKTKLGIYEVAGDTYKYCLAPAGKPRPKDLTSKEGSGGKKGGVGCLAALGPGVISGPACSSRARPPARPAATGRTRPRWPR